ncbi:cobalamin-binding protein [Luteibacter sp. ME-Dv--P-043b]|jgi:iron complex transport system substrate-binding protein|uniref:cobalamin-binding protein n=1 Tax=unclassified Luteibacter TaxID=2620188 RepID=UPI0025550C2C|nr:cobalamin-binding protein [Luteibacter sp. ME-Dv--P-043b]
MGPRRIVCLTEEPTETLYRLGEQDRIVGISGFTVRPPEARRDKPKVSAFTSAKIDRILALQPDLAVGFSDIQADIAQALIKAGVEVWISNHRSVEGILDYIRRLGALVGAAARANQLADELARGLDDVREASARLPCRPRVYFEEWDDPCISGIRWVSELVAIAGGDDVLPHRAIQSLARDRIVGDPAEIIATAPQIIIGSWCGKRFRPEQVAARAGWEGVPAIRDGELHEVKSPLILQPGPAALTDGLAALRRIIHGWSVRHG